MGFFPRDFGLNLRYVSIKNLLGVRVIDRDELCDQIVLSRIYLFLVGIKYGLNRFVTPK